MEYTQESILRGVYSAGGVRIYSIDRVHIIDRVYSVGGVYLVGEVYSVSGVGIHLMNGIHFVGITTVVLPLLIMYMLYDI